MSAAGSFSLGALGPGLKNSCGVSHVLYQEKSLTSPFLGGVPSATCAIFHVGILARPGSLPGAGGWPGCACGEPSALLCRSYPPPHLLAKLSQHSSFS